MTGVTQALFAFWGGFSLEGVPVPVYREDGLAPEQTEFPYILLRAEIPDSFATLETAATAWFRAESGANRQRMELCDQIAKAIPYQGVRLPLPGGGCIMLHRSTGAFLSDYTPGNENAAIGVRIGFMITNYTTTTEKGEKEYGNRT